MHTKEIILSYLSANLAGRLAAVSADFFETVTELRIRVDKPLLIYSLNQEYGLPPESPVLPEASVQGEAVLLSDVRKGYRPDFSDIAETVERISQYSLYALEEELRMGYITLPGGHRVGVVGKAVLENRLIRTIRPISGLNIRICRAVRGCGDNVLPRILDNAAEPAACGRLPHNTMIISPPGCGKTTLLRDIIRQLSDNCGLTVGVVDERSEIGGSYKGVAQNDVGMRTDLLDGCPKAEGMMLLLRAMAPDVIAVDELGGDDDIAAVENVSNAGIRLLCTVHGYSIEDIRQKPGLRALLGKGIFKRFVVLAAPGKEAEIYDSD